MDKQCPQGSCFELTDLARRLGNFLDSGLDTGASVRLSIASDTAEDEERTAGA